MRALVTLLVAGSVAASAAPAQARPLVLRAARLFDGRSDALAAPGVVVIDGGRILGVGARATIPDGAEVIDLGDATLLPGLMDAHSHLTLDSSDDWDHDELDWFKKTVPEVAIDSTRRARVTLEAGFTSVRDLGSYEFIDVGVRRAIDGGVVPGPRILAAGWALSARGGHCDYTAGYRVGLLAEPGITWGVIAGPDQAREAVRYNAKHGAGVIKVCASGGVLSLTDKVDSAQLTQAELDAIVDEAHALGLKAAAHAHGAEAAKRALRAGIDSIEHGSFIDDEGLALLKQKGAALVPTPTVCMADRLQRAGAPPQIQSKAKAASARQEQLLARALKAGVTIAFGSDAAVCPHGEQWKQMVYMVAHGMKPLAVLRAATSVDARLFGLDELGALEAGKVADVVAVAGDPTADMARMREVRLVVKDGAVVRRP